MRGTTYANDGSLCTTSVDTQTLKEEKVTTAQKDVAEGKLRPQREKDVLTHALGNKEHPGRM